VFFGFCFIGVRHARPIAWNTLTCIFAGTIFAFIGFCVGAAENAAAYVSVDIVVFVVFYTNWVAFSVCVTEKARSGGYWSFARETERVAGKSDGG